MLEMSNTAKRFDDLSDEAKKFLSDLRTEDIKTLQDGARLVNSAMTVGRFLKWVIISLLGMLAGIVMFGETVLKIVAWFRPPAG
jgi:hypothetical protein